MNPYANPQDPGAIKAKRTPLPTSASRAPAHDPGKKNDLKSMTANQSKPSFGKLGIRGDGHQA